MALPAALLLTALQYNVPIQHGVLYDHVAEQIVTNSKSALN